MIERPVISTTPEPHSTDTPLSAPEKKLNYMFRIIKNEEEEIKDIKELSDSESEESGVVEVEVNNSEIYGCRIIDMSILSKAISEQLIFFKL